MRAREESSRHGKESRRGFYRCIRSNHRSEHQSMEIRPSPVTTVLTQNVSLYRNEQISNGRGPQRTQSLPPLPLPPRTNSPVYRRPPQGLKMLSPSLNLSQRTSNLTSRRRLRNRSPPGSWTSSAEQDLLPLLLRPSLPQRRAKSKPNQSSLQRYQPRRPPRRNLIPLGQRISPS